MCKLFILVPSYIAKFPKPIECPYLVLPPSPVGLAGGRGRSAWLEDVAGGRGQWAWLEDVAVECGRRAWLEGVAGGRGWRVECGRRAWPVSVASGRGWKPCHEGVAVWKCTENSSLQHLPAERQNFRCIFAKLLLFAKFVRHYIWWKSPKHSLRTISTVYRLEFMQYCLPFKIYYFKHCIVFPKI